MKNTIGLTSEEVLKSREAYGSNKIKEQEPKKFWTEWLGNFEDPMLKLLLGITVLMGVIAMLGFTEWYEVLGIALSVTIVTLISTKTAMTSDGEYRKLKAETSYESCKVYRDGEIKIIDVNDLVIGDMVIVQSGEKVHADGHLFSGNIKIDNSTLNGETDEVAKEGTSEYKYSRNMTDNHTLLRGALVVDGEGVMKVVRVGIHTLVGEMAEEMSEEQVDSPLKVKLTKLAEQISLFGYIGATVIGVGLLLNTILGLGFEGWLAQPIPLIFKNVLDALLVAVTIVVMAVPEGLPLMIAIVLMQNTKKMLNHNVLVRNAVGIETAGSINILFSDKTGTITKGQLEVVKFIDINGNTYDNIKDIPQEYIQSVASEVRTNTSSMIIDGQVVGGNATDRALLTYIKDQEFVEFKDIVKVETFNSAKKYSAVEVKGECDSTITLYKGAVEKILERCDLENGVRLNIESQVQDMANNAIRVLALAWSTSPIVEGELPTNLTLSCVVGIRDDVRPEAKVAIKEVQKAGVQVVMITGDRKETAYAIAKDSGLITQESDIVLTSNDLQELSDDQLKEMLPNIRVIARALPTDKSRLVRISQELNLVCSMTGDGSNDAPALKRADVGFAMGSGTDVAKQAGDIVILDDNFKSIADSVLYGRTIYNNIMKFIKFQLTINVVAVFICAICPFFGIEQPLTIVQLLVVNLIMDGLGALALGGEPALKEYMNEKPKSRTQSIVTKDMCLPVGLVGLWMAILSLAFLFAPDFRTMFGEAHLTGYYNLFVFMAVFNGFNVRNDSVNIFKGLKDNPQFVKVMGSIAVIQIVLTFIGGDMLGVTPMTLTQWVIVIGMATLVIPFSMGLKHITKLFKNSK